MKTNKQLAEEVLNRAKNDDYTSSYTTPPKKHKSITIAICSCLATILICSVFIFAGLAIYNYNNRFNFNLDKMYIANFSSYQAIGAGAYTSNQKSNTNLSVSIANAAQSGGNYLVGVDMEGKIERLKYTKDKDDKGKGKEIELYLSGFRAFKNYTLINFSIEKPYALTNEYFGKNYYNNKYINLIYIIDNKTGRFYSLDKIDFNYISFTYRYNDFNCDEFLESDTSLYLKFNYRDDRAICKLTIENDVLIVKQVYKISQNLYIDPPNYYNYIVDKYDNVYLGERLQFDSLNYGKAGNVYPQYLINKEGKIIDIAEIYNEKIPEGYNKVYGETQGLFVSINGEVYSTNKKYKFVENGDFVENSFDGGDIFFSNANLVKKDGNVEYYLAGGITKITWKNEIEFDYEVIPTSISELNVATKDYVYYCADKKLYRAEITTGKSEELPLENKYFFTSIATDNLGNVEFVALDEYQNNIHGKIDNEGHVDINVTPQRFEIYYIKPLKF